MRVVLAEDSVLLRQGLVALLTEHPAVDEVIEAGDLGEYTVGADGVVLLGDPFVFDADNIGDFDF